MQDWFEENAIRPHLLMWVILVLLWGNSIYDDTLTIDTGWLVVNNPILQSKSFATVYTILFDFSIGTRLTLGAEYLPVRDFTVWFDWLVFGDSWAGHHLHSFLWYGLCCSLLWSCNRLIFGHGWMTWLGTVIFVVHPTHVESVVWLASRKDVVSLALMLWAIKLHLEQRSVWAIGVIALLAYWAKNTSIVLGPLLVLISFSHHRDWSTKRFTEPSWWLQWFPVAVPLIFGLYLTLSVGSSVGMFAHPRGETGIETFNIAVQTWTEYGKMLVWPERLSLLYAEPSVQPWTQPSILVGLVIVSALLFFPLYFWNRTPLWTLACWTIPLGLLPVSQISPIQNLMADRYLLVSTIGLSWMGILVLQQFQQRRLTGYTMGVWIVVLGYFTHQRIPLFQSDVAIWTDVTYKQPLEIRGWTTLAAHYRKQNEINKAQHTILQAYTIHPKHPKLALASGMLSLQRGETEDALRHFEEAWTQDNTLREAANNWALLLQRNKPTKAVEVSKELTQLHPLYAQGWDVLGSSCLNSKDFSCAQQALEKAHSLNPHQVSTLANLGTLAYLNENWTEAQRWWLETVALDPQHDYAQRGLQALQEVPKAP